MDPRNLHIQLDHVIKHVQWEPQDGNEYFLIGDGEQFYLDRMQSALDQHFSSELILASPSRHEVILLERPSAAGTIAQHIQRLGSFTVFDHGLHTFMQFTRTGVARMGRVAS